MGEIVSETRRRRPSERHALGLEVIDAMTGLQAGDDVVFLVDPIGRNDERDMPADGLRSGVAKEPFGRRHSSSE